MPQGLLHWRDTKLESGIYFVINEVNEWAPWSKSAAAIAPLTTWSWTKGNYTSERFYAAAVSCFSSYDILQCLNPSSALKFLFMRNVDGGYYISNWCNLGQPPIERFLQVFDGGPTLRETKSNCHLYRDKDDSDVYVYVIVIGPAWPSTYQIPSSSIAISDSKSEPDVIVYDPSTTKENDKLVCPSTPTLVSWCWSHT